MEIGEAAGAGASWSGAGTLTAGALHAGGRSEELQGVGLADFVAEFFGVFEGLELRFLIGGQEAEGLFARLGVVRLQLFTEGLYFQHGAADGGGGLECLLFGFQLFGDRAIGVGGGTHGGGDGGDLGIGEIQVRLDFGDGRCSRGATGRGLRKAEGGSENGENEFLKHGVIPFQSRLCCLCSVKREWGS